MANNSKTSVTCDCLEMGGVLAMIISWSLYQSILWAILHGFCNWFYVFYYMLTNN